MRYVECDYVCGARLESQYCGDRYLLWRSRPVIVLLGRPRLHHIRYRNLERERVNRRVLELDKQYKYHGYASVLSSFPPFLFLYTTTGISVYSITSSSHAHMLKDTKVFRAETNHQTQSLPNTLSPFSMRPGCMKIGSYFTHNFMFSTLTFLC